MKKINIHLALIFLCILFESMIVNSQSSLSLEDLLHKVLENSFSVKLAKKEKEIKKNDYEIYKTELKPLVGLRGDLPNYSKTSLAIVQPDGSIAFQSIRQANSSIGAFASQVIPGTGGSIFLNSEIQRFDDLSLDLNSYNGIPIRAGIFQPIFGYNRWKFRKKLENLFVHEADIIFNVQIENAFLEATQLFFDILIAKENLAIANANEKVNNNLLDITNERLILGKVSRDEKLQLEIELNNARVAVSNANYQLKNAIARLYNYIDEALPSNEINFLVPKDEINREINLEKLLSSYQNNRPEIIAYQIELAENDQDLAKIKSDYGLQASIQASLGLARGSNEIKEIYTDPFDEQQLNVSFSIPIMDWGKKKSLIKRNQLDRDATEINYNRQIENIETSIRQGALFFISLQNQLQLLKETMLKANDRFDISNQRYVLGNIDITNLTLAQRDKDQTKRNYINAVRDFWLNYYQLRILSGFDVLNNKQINYN